MSILGKKWLIKNKSQDKTIFEKLIENKKFNPLEEEEIFHDPFLFADMEKSVARIKKAIKDKERIIVFGDYDVDGITATAILVHTLNKLGAVVSYRLPNREFDGYGLSEKFIDEFIEKNIKLLITVDCGISCDKEVKKAKENNIDVIITDHHTIPKNPPEKAHSILHPKYNSSYPFTELTGAGVALKFAHALLKTEFPEEEALNFLENLLDLAALGTVADLGEMLGENRFIVKKGLEILKNTKWSGLKKIMNLCDIKEGENIDVGKIGFRIAPRINAAGRIGDPYIALFLLLQKEFNEKVDFLGDKLEKLNKTRQDMTIKAFEEIQGVFEEGKDTPMILIAHNKDWHVGILGLIAGKIAELYNRPAIIMQELDDIFTGSARSPEYFNIIEALTNSSEHLIAFGGHCSAAGFSLKKESLEDFKKSITEFSKQKYKGQEIKSILEIDCEITEEDINFDLIKEIEKFEPFGVKNTKPIFLFKNAKPFLIKGVGAGGAHIKFSLKIKNNNIDVIGFRLGKFAEDLKNANKLDLVCHFEKNIWRNNESLQLQALDFNFDL